MKILLLAHTLHYTFATPYRYPLPINVVTPNHSVQPPKSKSRAPCNRGARFLWGFMAGAIFMCSGVNRKRIELTGSRAQLRGVRCDRGFWSFSLLRSSMVPREKNAGPMGGSGTVLRDLDQVISMAFLGHLATHCSQPMHLSLSTL